MSEYRIEISKEELECCDVRCDVCNEFKSESNPVMRAEVGVDGTEIIMIGHKACLKQRLEEIKILIENAPTN